MSYSPSSLRRNVAVCVLHPQIGLEFMGTTRGGSSPGTIQDTFSEQKTTAVQGGDMRRPFCHVHSYQEKVVKSQVFTTMHFLVMYMAGGADFTPPHKVVYSCHSYEFTTSRSAEILLMLQNVFKAHQ